MSRTSSFPPLNTGDACAMADAFHNACGVPCQLCDGDGKVLSGQEDGGRFCTECRTACRRLGQEPACEKVHLYGALQAERFGGQYIYFCPCGLTWFASPILTGGRLNGALVGGPVLIMDEDDFFAHGPFQRDTAEPLVIAAVRADLSVVSRMAPSRVSSLARLLYASALSLGDGGERLQANRRLEAQQGEISDYISTLKRRQRTAGQAEGYPVEKERELVRAISQGDQATAMALLNEILGHLMFAGSDLPTLRARVTELLVVLSRAAISGGADAEQIFGLNYFYLKELDNQSNFVSLCKWLTDILRRFTSLVFEVSAIKHRDIIYKAAAFIREHYRDRITLEDTAEFVGYSPSYFSRVFKADMGESFNGYLNSLRIERSKTLLLQDGATVLSVSQEVGFDDPSYFSRVFRRVTGMSPGKFRETGGRIPRSGEGIA